MPLQRASAHRLFGTALRDMGQVERALAQFEKAVAIAPDYAEAHFDLGYALYKLGRSEEAVSHYRRAINLKPDDATARCGLGLALAAVGHLDEAKTAFEAAIGLAPRDANNYFHLAQIVRFTRDDRHFLAMLALAKENVSLPLEGQVYLHFALGKAYADIDDHEQSFHHLLMANTLKQRLRPYDEALMLGRLKRIPAIFTPALMREKAGLGEPSSQPIFIVGMHRSGTTLVEQMLATHPKCFGAGEREAMGTIVGQLHGSSADDFLGAVQSLTQARIRELGTRYLSAIRRQAPTVARITDKMPGNFVYLGLIHLLFPNARIIHTRRDPRDTALSCFATPLGQGNDYSCDLAAMGRYYRAYLALMAHWRAVLPEHVMLEIDYERLTEDFDGQARQIVAHCGLDWDDACLGFYRNARPVMTRSVSQVREPVHSRSVGKWRSYERHLRPFTDVLEWRIGVESGCLK